MKKSNIKKFPLVIEDHPDDYFGFEFITLIQYQNNDVLTIVDNSDDKEIKAFVLDLCGPSNIKEELIINIANNWFETNYNNFPLSIQFSRLGILDKVRPIYKKFAINYVSRVIGPMAKFEMNEIMKIKRKKRKPLPSNIEIIKKQISFPI